MGLLCCPSSTDDDTPLFIGIRLISDGSRPDKWIKSRYPIPPKIMIAEIAVATFNEIYFFAIIVNII